MRSMIGLVTDSNSQITRELADRFQVEVVPLTVTIDGVEFLEGVDLDADGLYAHFGAGRTPSITTSQPSPGRFAEAYRRLAEVGCSEIVSIHISEAMSGTIGSATLAARDALVPVHIIDTGSASFGVSVCVWTAGVAIERGAGVEHIRQLVATVAPLIGTVFMIGIPLLTERGGRAAGPDFVVDGDGIPVLSMRAGALELLERVTTIEDAVDVMSTYAAGWGDRMTVAIGTADDWRLSARLESALSGLSNIDAVTHYRVGPTVGAHTGPGTFGLFVFPTPS